MLEHHGRHGSEVDGGRGRGRQDCELDAQDVLEDEAEHEGREPKQQQGDHEDGGVCTLAAAHTPR